MASGRVPNTIKIRSRRIVTLLRLVRTEAARLVRLRREDNVRGGGQIGYPDEAGLAMRRVTVGRNQDRPQAGGVRAGDVGLAVADHPRAADIEIELGGCHEDIVGARLAVERRAAEMRNR